MSQKAITTSSFAARLEYVEADERAELHERAGSFGPYPAQMQYYLEEGFHWYIHRGDLVIDGDFDNDMFLVVEGDLTVRGTYNDYRGDSGHLLVLGDVRAEHVLSWNAFSASGSLYAAGLVLGYYNDFTFEVFGPLIAARGLVMVDKFRDLPDRREVEFSSYEEGDDDPLDAHLAPQMLDWLDEDHDEITVEEARKLRRAGAEVRVHISDWDEACDQVYAGTAFLRPYTLPADPDDDSLRLALLQPAAPESVFELASGREGLLYDVGLAPAAPAALLAELAERSTAIEDGARVAFAVASHPSTPPSTLASLAGHDAATVRAAVIHNPSCTAELATRLLGDASPGVRRALAASPLATPHLDRLIADRELAVRRAVASHRGLTLAQRRRLIADDHPRVRGRALFYTPTSAELVREFAASDNAELRRWAAQRANQLARQPAADSDPAAEAARLSLEERHQQLLDPSREVRETALRGASWLRFSFIETHGHRFASDESSELRRAAARLCRSPEILDQLSRDPDRDVRRAVGENLATPPEVLVALAKRNADLADDRRGPGMSPRESFANDLMKNPLLPAAAFEHIARVYPRAYHMEEHPNLPLALYVSYERFDDPYEPGEPEYRDLAEAHQLVDRPEELLTLMARSSRGGFRSMAALSSSTPPAELLKMLDEHYQDEYLMRDLARNAYLGSGTPAAGQLIERLLAHEDDEVAGAVVGNPHVPREVIEREAHRDLDSARRVLWSRHGIELDTTGWGE